jgi:predicted NUDIX family phosphoesterase
MDRRHSQFILCKGIAVSAVATEKVLVVPTSLFRELGYFQDFSTEVARYFPRLLTGDHLAYRPRGQMEEDPSFKQLIPYVLFRWTDEAGVVHLFEYLRGGGSGEKRLRAKRSVGVGGHISSLDAEMISTLRDGGHLAVGNEDDIYREGMRRELDEEVVIETAYDERIVGLINDDLTPVGQVHLGVVHLCDVAEPLVRAREADVLEAGFRPVHELLPRLEEFETWSQIAVRALFA